MYKIYYFMKVEKYLFSFKIPATWTEKKLEELGNILVI